MTDDIGAQPAEPAAPAMTDDIGAQPAEPAASATTGDRLRLAAAVAAGLGLAIAAYLTYVHYAGVAPICAASGGCERVQSSTYAKVAGVPVALMGVVGYAAILIATLLPGEPSRLAACWLALVGLGFSLYLTYLELFEIDAICQWCLASAGIMAALAVMTTLRAVSSPADGY